MSLQMDPAGAEIRALKNITNWRGKRVLEVGCGQGRLSLRLAAFGPMKLIAFDPDASSIRAARKALPKKYQDRIEYHLGNAEHTNRKDGEFDIVVFSWVL